MSDKEVIAEILALADRLDRGLAATDDLLRAEVDVAFPENNTREVFPFDGETFDAMSILIDSAKRRLESKRELTRKILRDRLGLIYYGLRSKKIGPEFFAHIGNNLPPP